LLKKKSNTLYYNYTGDKDNGIEISI